MKTIFNRALITGVLCCMMVMSAQAAAVNNFTFKDTDIKVVLASIAELAKSEGKNINIVSGPTVTGTVTIDLSQVDWETALDVILRTYNLEAYHQENVIIVNPIGPGGSVVKNEIKVKVFNLKYIDANDALKAIAPILSPSGKTSVLQTIGQSGAEFGADNTDKKAETIKRTNVLVVSDSAERLEQVSTLLEQLDVIMANPMGPAGSTAKNEILVKVFTLKYIDSNDALKAIAPILSVNGKASVLQTTGQSGWEFGTDNMEKKSETSDKKLKRTKVLVVSDSAERLEMVSSLLKQLDVMPKQILIKARILEVDYQLLTDSGLDFGTGATGAETSALQTVGGQRSQIATHAIATVTPSSFLPQTSGLTTANSGLQLMFRQLSGTQLEVILHALEEKTWTTTLSAPILMTLNNQEATILVGEKFPITQTTVSDTTNDVIGGSLQYYQDIGIKLNVVPQIWGKEENYINLIVHPVVSTTSSSVDIIDGSTNTTLDQYPIINIQEAETQLVIPDNGTVMMGGLITDVKGDQVIGVPFLSKIPYLGNLFNRTVKNKKKVELIIFITAHIMAPEEQVLPNIVDTKEIEQHFDKKGK